MPSGSGRNSGARQRHRHSGVALATVFEMFSQLEPALERAKGGLGIGLALVRGIVALHGGSIHADSAGPAKGSEFTVRLPLAASAACPGAEEAGHALPARGRVLVVDDNKDAAETLTMALQLSGCETRSCIRPAPRSKRRPRSSRRRRCSISACPT
jgi:hypothetical protein